MTHDHYEFELRLFLRDDILRDAGAIAPLVDLIRADARFATTTWRTRQGEGALDDTSVRSWFGRKAGLKALRLSGEGEYSLAISGYGDDVTPGSMIWGIVPAALLREQSADAFIDLVVAICRAAPPIYGWAHPAADLDLSLDPLQTNPFAKPAIVDAYWLLVLGASLAKEVGSNRIESLKAHRVERLPDGSVVIATTADPLAALTEDGRAAAADVVVHLRPDLDRAALLIKLTERSAKLEPVEATGEPDLEPAYRMIADGTPAAERRAIEEHVRGLPVPDPDEWRPVEPGLRSDVEDEAAEIRRYTNEAGAFEAGFHEAVPELLDSRLEALPLVDAHFYLEAYADREPGELEEKVVPTLGSLVGDILVRELDGRWIPRRDRDEAMVVVGDRAWLPFLRVRHFVASRDDAIEHSLAHFVREAQRLAEGT